MEFTDNKNAIKVIEIINIDRQFRVKLTIRIFRYLVNDILKPHQYNKATKTLIFSNSYAEYYGN